MHKFTIACLALSATVCMPVLAQKKGDAVKGKEVFEQCGVCHSATTNEKKMGPSLKGVFKRATLKNGKKVTEASVTDVIHKGGNGMPPFAGVLSAVEVTNLLAYLKSL